MTKKKPESKWNKETVREKILALYNDGHHLTEKNAKKFYPGLPYASKKFHGTWVEALKQSGVPLRDLHRTNWTEKMVECEILGLFERGESLRAKDVSQNYPRLFTAAHQLFNGLRNAVESLGLL